MFNSDEICMNVVNGKMGIRQALDKVANECLAACGKESEKHLLWGMYGDKCVFIRTVTHHYTGRMVCLADGFIKLSEAAWIADDGRFNAFLTKGEAKEVEPFPSGACVAIGSIVDICEWTHALPRSAK